MPNIIEQQDLLKGLPDARLATLLQNPVADIPPFLVAAEAQRRQAIRQQFSGSGANESVVDNLTKQLTRVPQNIGEKSTPTESADLKGILDKNAEIKDAISSQQEEDQKSMASGGIVRRYAAGGIASIPPKGTMYGFTPGVQMEQALGNVARASSVIPQTMGAMPGYLGYQARPQQPQQMRRGGIVQRYQSAGQVVSLDARIKGIAEQFGVSIGEAAEMLKRDPRMGAGGPEEEMGVAPPIPETNREARAEPSTLDLPGITTSQEELAKKQREAFREGKYREMDAYPGYAGNSSVFAQPDMGGMTDEEVMRDLEAQKRRLNKSGAGVSPEDAKPKPGETPDEFRARLAELVKAQEPSNFDRAQRWFSAAEQFLNPSKTTMQSIAGAGRAFTEVSAELEREKRNAQLAEQKALLEYDIAERDRLRSAEAERANKEYETKQKILERRNPPAADVLKTLGSLVEDINGRIAKMQEFGMVADPKAIEALESQKRAYMIQMAEILKGAGYGPSGAITIEQLEALAGQ